MKQHCLLPLFLLTGCGNNMVQQARYDAYEAAPIFPHHMAMQEPPVGTVTREAAQRDKATKRPEMNLALVQRGRERFNIYCTPCHGFSGAGNGVVPARGFPHPPDLRSARLRRVPASHFYDVMTHGYGVMFSYADRVKPHDRWAIAAYIRALQTAQTPPQASEAANAG